MKKKNEISILRSSAAEYLTFLTATGQSDVNAVYADENVWLSQKMMGCFTMLNPIQSLIICRKLLKQGN